jgi:hypothetical protein
MVGSPRETALFTQASLFDYRLRACYSSGIRPQINPCHLPVQRDIMGLKKQSSAPRAEKASDSPIGKAKRFIPRDGDRTRVIGKSRIVIGKRVDPPKAVGLIQIQCSSASKASASNFVADRRSHRRDKPRWRLPKESAGSNGRNPRGEYDFNANFLALIEDCDAPIK